MIIHCKYDELVPVDELKPHPQNRNTHPTPQITRLAEILNYQGWRYPVKVSKRSGYVTSGHGRIEASKINGWEKIPVNFQDYESYEQEYADVQSDNAIGSWSYLNINDIKKDLNDIDPNFNLDLLGIRELDEDDHDHIEHWKGMPEFESNDETAFKSIKVNFYSQKDIEDFSKLVGQTVTEKTTYINFPYIEPEKYDEQLVVDEK